MDLRVLLPSLFFLLLWSPFSTAEGPQSAVEELSISYSLATDEDLPSSSDHQTDIWKRIQEGFRLEDVNPKLTRTHEHWYAKRPDNLSRALERSRPYLFHIVEEVEKRGMPMEIALLPVIESSYNPAAMSNKKASGLWQFIPSTGRVYGLEQNAWYDGRRDVLAATQAALDYLEKLHDQFDSWELALAAYNCGEGCVSRAIQRNRAKGKPTGYADLRLPTETRHYVPKLVAVRNIVMQPERYDIALEEIANRPYFMQVRLRNMMESNKAAELAEMNLNEFLSLNPAFQRRVIHSDTPGVLLLPAEKIEVFHFNMHRQGDRSQLQAYRAERGQSLASIAKQFGVTLQWLKDRNPLKLIRGKLATTQTLVVPKLAGNSKASGKRRVVARYGKDDKNSLTHTVSKGETLSSLALQYKVKLSELRAHNQSVLEPLSPGDTVAIPASNG